MTAISQSGFLQALGWAVMNSLWQMALLWIVYQVLTAVLRLQKPAQKATLASSLLFAGFTWFVFTFLVVLEKNPQASPYITLVNIASNNETLNQWFRTTLPWASLVYLVLLTLPVIHFIRNYRYVQYIRHHGISKTPVQWRMFVQKTGGILGIRKPVQIWLSEFVNSPVTIGYLKPVILLPVAAINQLTPQQIEAVLLHELSHIRRLDYLTNLLIRMVQTVLYFNPFVKAFVRIIEFEREKSCDEMVVQFQYEPYGYASALLELEKAAHPTCSKNLVVAAAAGGKKNQLLSRVESILGIQKKKVFSFYKFAGVLCALFALVALNALIIISKPSKAKISQGLFLSQLSSPMGFIPEDNTNARIPAVQELPDQSLALTVDEIAKPDEDALAIENADDFKFQNINPAITDEFIQKTVDNAVSHFAHVANLESIIPELTPQQEKQVKEALQASKKVLEETQWKAVEKSIADAMTIAEKEKFKLVFEKATAETEKAQLEKLYNKVKIAYDQIDWDNLNTNLSIAMNNIRLDSLRQVYSLAMTELSTLEKEMKQQGMKGIPDSDITVERLEKKIQDLQKARTKVQAMRNKRVIDL